MSKFPEKLFGNLVTDKSGEVVAYLTVEGAADGDRAIRVGIYQLVEVVEARAVTTTTVSTVKVEN